MERGSWTRCRCNIGRGAKCCRYLSIRGDACTKEGKQAAMSIEGETIDCPGMRDLFWVNYNIAKAYKVDEDLRVVRAK